jgi:hypothetical protein
VLTLAFAFVSSYSAVLGLRFVIGVFEAGFFPGDYRFDIGTHSLGADANHKSGIIYLITFWYRQEERSLRIAFVTASATLAGAFGV